MPAGYSRARSPCEISGDRDKKDQLKRALSRPYKNVYIFQSLGLPTQVTKAHSGTLTHRLDHIDDSARNKLNDDHMISHLRLLPQISLYVYHTTCLDGHLTVGK